MKFTNLIKEAMGLGNDYYVAVYSKAKTKKDLQRIVKDNPQDPPIDMSESPGRGPMGTPQEIKDNFGLKFIIVHGIQDKYIASLMYKSGKWTVK